MTKETMILNIKPISKIKIRSIGHQANLFMQDIIFHMRRHLGQRKGTRVEHSIKRWIAKVASYHRSKYYLLTPMMLYEICQYAGNRLMDFAQRNETKFITPFFFSEMFDDCYNKEVDCIPLACVRIDFQSGIIDTVIHGKFKFETTAEQKKWGIQYSTGWSKLILTGDFKQRKIQISVTPSDTPDDEFLKEYAKYYDVIQEIFFPKSSKQQ